MYERIVHIAGGFVIAATLALAVFNWFSDPLAAARLDFENQLVRAEVEEAPHVATERPFAAWQEKIAARPKLWSELVAPPPPPEVKPPPPPECPKIEEFLEGVKPTRQAIGKKVKIITPDNERGEFFTEGDAINGCVITKIDRASVTFQFECTSRKQTLTASLPRE